ncbi:MAG: radical SAM protein [Myxococcaceae bacterium]
MNSERITIELTRECNNACVFCARAPARATPLISAAVTPGADVVFVGGEPTLVPTLASQIADARAKGARRIGLQTNGRRLADVELTRALAEAGLDEVHFTLEGGDPMVHDFHTQVPGSFAEVMAALAACRAQGLALVVTTVVTRSNFRVLSGLPALLQLKGVAAWQVTMPVVAGRAATAMDRVVPRHALALPYVLHALDQARKLGVEGFVRHAPLCLLGPWASRALGPMGGDAGRYGAACDGCAARPACNGLDPVYRARFGDEELQRQTSVPPARVSSKWSGLFIGEGDVSLVEGLVVPSPPAAARAQIATLGKGQAAVAEVGRGERKSGEALKEIFPTLFTEPKD